jgi:hypothetical protein
VNYALKTTGFAASDFACNLAAENFKRIFADTPYATYSSYEEALDAYRQSYREGDSALCQQIASRMFDQPIWDLAYETLRPYFLETEGSGFADLFVKDTHAVQKRLRPTIGQGSAYTTALKMTAYASLFDAHRNGNYPYLAGNRFINGRKIGVLRHGVPVREWVEPTALLPKSTSGDDLREESKESKTLRNSCVAEEYRAFLDHCSSSGRKILYNCLLNPRNREKDELPRIEALFKLGLEEKYKHVFHFIRMPADGPIAKGCQDGGTLQSYKELLQTNMETLRTWSDADFQSWETVSKKDLSGFFPGSSKVRDIILEKYPPLLDFAYSMILRAYDSNDLQDLSAKELVHLLQEKKQAFMMLFCTLLKMSLITELGITDYNNTCKDAIDRGSMHMICDFLWDCFCSDDLVRSEYNLRVQAAWPATMAKTQAILHDRAEWITSFARFLKRAGSNQDFKNAIFSFCRKHKLSPSGYVNFINSDKSDRFFVKIISKLERVFTHSRKIQIPNTFDARTLSQNQEPLKNSILKGLSSWLERCHYHNLPLELLKEESELDLTSTSEDETTISGEMGFFSLNSEEAIGGPVFSIGAQGKKIGELEVALQWKILKKDLGTNPMPIELSVISKLSPVYEEWDTLDEEAEAIPAQDLANQKKAERSQAIQEKLEARQLSLRKRRQSEDRSFDVELSQPEIRDRLAMSDRVLGDDVELRRPYRVKRSRSVGSFLDGLRNSNTESPVIREKVVNGSLEEREDSPLVVSDQFPEDLSPAKPVEIQLQNIPPRRYRMGRDIAFLGAGAILGSAITLWARSFFGFPKSKNHNNDIDPVITKNEKVVQEKQSDSHGLTQTNPVEGDFSSVKDFVQSDKEPKERRDKRFFVSNTTALVKLPEREPRIIDLRKYVNMIVRDDVITPNRRMTLEENFSQEKFQSSNSSKLIPIGKRQPASLSRGNRSTVEFPGNIVPNPGDLSPTLGSEMAIIVPDGTNDRNSVDLRSRALTTIPLKGAEFLGEFFPIQYNAFFPFLMTSATTSVFPFSLSRNFNGLSTISQNFETPMLGAPETVATGSTAESLNSGISTNEEIEETLNHTGISTSSKVMAGIVLGVGIVYTAVKTYRYFQSKVQNPIKKAIAAETTKALEVSPPMYAKTLWERFLLKAQGFVNRFS